MEMPVSRMLHSDQNPFGVFILGAAVGILGFAVWSNVAPPRIEQSSAYSERPDAPQQTPVDYRVNPSSAAYQPGSALQSGAAESCSPWDVSSVAMEAILQEMILRGWQPPRSDIALADTQPSAGRPIEAISPEEPVTLGPPRPSPIEIGEAIVVGTPGAETDSAASAGSAPDNAPAAATATPATAPPAAN
jgi:hypothetical protein